MAFNFPNSPTVGQIFTPVLGTSYTWNGYAWVTTSVTIGIYGMLDFSKSVNSGATTLLQDL